MVRRNLMIAGALALCMAFTAQIALACDHDKAAGASMNGTCGAKSSLTAIFKDAPGTKTEFRKVDNGVALVVTASSREYVPVVQTALMKHMDEMMTMAQGTSGSCAMHSDKASMEKTSGGCPMHSDKASMEKTSGSCPMHSDKASVEKTTTSGASCCATHAGATKASLTSADCPEWMKVLCSADMKVVKTDKGVMITWTSSKKEMVEQVRAAGEKFQAEINQL